MRRQTKPFALLAAAIASKSAFAGLVGASATVTVTTTSTDAAIAPGAPASTQNFEGLTTGGLLSTQMLIQYSTDSDGTATTAYLVSAGYNFGAATPGADFILYTGLKQIEMLGVAHFDVRIRTLVLSDGMFATAVFTFGGAGQLLSFTETTMNAGMVISPSGSTANTLSGTADTNNWVSSGGFTFGVGGTVVTNIDFTLVATYTDPTPMNGGYGFHLDAIVGNAIPEPSSLALFGAGTAFGAFWIARRRARAQQKRT